MNNPNSNTNNLVEKLRQWFLTPNEIHPETLLANLDLMNITQKFNFGNRMINEALEMQHELEMVGATSEVRDIEQDVFIMRVNLNKVRKAYNLAMN